MNTKNISKKSLCTTCGCWGHNCPFHPYNTSKLWDNIYMDKQANVRKCNMYIKIK